MRTSSNSIRHITTVMLILLFALIPTSIIVAPVSAAYPDNIVINEVLVSPNNAEYNGTDWNGDGSFGTYNDMFVELYNPTSADVDISEWMLDDIAGGGSPACSIGYNTTLSAGGYMVFYRADTDIEFDYWDGDSIRISDKSGNLVDETTFPGEDSVWDVSYARDANGDWMKIGPPTPGIANDQPWQTADGGPGIDHDIGTCFVERDYYHTGSYVLEGRIVTMQSEDSVIPYGSVMVTDGMIEEVWASGQQPAELNLTDVPIIKTEGTIYPGLIDAHNHIHYNFVPLWEYSLDHRGGDLYTNRYQWKDNPTYSIDVTGAKSLLQGWDYWDLEHESMKYVEVRSLVGGTTSVQGNPTGDDDEFASILARNIEYYNFGKDYIHTKVTELESDYQGNHIKTGNASGELDAWFLHLAEGLDASSLAEFQILLDNDLLVGELMLIHGAALGQPEFAAMGEVGADLVWSPTSNLLLYGDTAKVDIAKQEGVKISLAPDWAPSGSKNPMHELKTADWLDSNRLGNIFSDYEQIQMVTTNPADGMNWDEYVGRIAPGMYADLLVIDSFHSNPYRNLIEAIDPDVKLTIVGGIPIFGDGNLMYQLKGDDFELMQGDGFTKVVDVTFQGVNKGDQTWGEIESVLQAAMQFELDEMYANFTYAASMTEAEFADWFNGKYPGLTGSRLESIFTFGDDAYFAALNNSVAFQSQGTIDLWSTYYDVELGADGYRTQRDLIEIPDSDDDGVDDSSDAFPNDPTENMDSDGDGVGDNADLFPNDADETVDSDSDGVGDNGDAFPNDPAETLDSDGDGIGDNADPTPFPDTPDGETCTFGQTKKQDCNNCFCNSESTWSCEDNVCGSGLGAAGSSSKSLMYVIIGSISIGILLAVAIGMGFFRRDEDDDGSEWAAEMAKADPIEEQKAPEMPPMDAAPTPDSSAPPLPASGLPAGWTTEQWQHYGEEYLRDQ